MYYTATERSTSDQCIGMATASDPLGPYADSESQPAVCDNDSDAPPTIDDGYDGGSIDPDIFTDPASGNDYLLWKSDGNHLAGDTTTTIWSAPLSQNLQRVTALGQPLLSNTEAWQSNIIEGPDMYDNQVTTGSGSGATTNDNYYLFYAGSDEGASTYGIGWATARVPPDPAQTNLPAGLSFRPNPACPAPVDLTSTRCPRSQTVMAFAAWEGTTIGYVQCGVRPMYLADLAFSGGNAEGVGAFPSAVDLQHGGRWANLPGTAHTCARVLAGRFGRRGLHLRRRQLLRVDRLHKAEPARRGDGPDPRPSGLLAHRIGRWRVRLR